MKNASALIDQVLTEASLDARIRDGVVNLHNVDHAIVIAEKMYDSRIDLNIIQEFVDEYVATEGKYPDRQAYNKEGWLVTFPSAEYRNAAIKKGTHYTSDPTHGKGGMNLYYKRKGKQKRMTHQDPTQTEPSQSSQPSQLSSEPQSVQATDKQSKGENPKGGEQSIAQATDNGKSELPVSEPPAGPGEDPDAPESGTEQGGNIEPPQRGGETIATDVKPVQAAPPTPAPPSFVNISVEFAKNKQWNPTPYGEWRNAMGETVAVVALSGEVVPIKTTDREEMKIFATKKQP